MATTTGGQAPSSGDYYVNLITGTIQQQHNSLLAKALMVAGFAGPFATIDDAKAAFNAAKGPAASALSGGLGAATADAAVPSLTSPITGALAPLFQPNLWLRVLEVVGGLVVLAIGLNAMFKGRPLQVVTGAAGVVGKVVP